MAKLFKLRERYDRALMNTISKELLALKETV